MCGDLHYFSGWDVRFCEVPVIGKIGFSDYRRFMEVNILVREVMQIVVYMLCVCIV